MKNMKRIHTVTIKRMVDPDPDTSYLGEYGNRPTSEFSIDRQHALDCVLNSQGDTDNESLTDCEECEHLEVEHVDGKCIHGSANGNTCECSGYSPKALECSECGECRDSWDRREYQYFNPSFNYVDKFGKALKENTPDDVRRYVRQDYERMERLNAGDWCYIGIRAYASVQVAKDGPLQEISSGGLWGIESDSEKGYLADVEKEELSDLRTQLHALGFSQRAISAAFKNVERKDE